MIHVVACGKQLCSLARSLVVGELEVRGRFSTRRLRTTTALYCMKY